MIGHRSAELAAITRESVLAILADQSGPISGVQLQAAHGRFDQYVYTQLVKLQRAGKVVRIRPLITSGNSVYWCLPEHATGTCAIGECAEITNQFVGPLLHVEDIRVRGRVHWREIREVPGTGGWACGQRGTGRHTHIAELMHARRQRWLALPNATPARDLAYAGTHTEEGNGL